MGKGIEGYAEKALFSYSISHLENKDKVRFYYALKGRDGKSGIIKQYTIDQIAKGVLLVSLKFERDIEEFLKLWKCDFKKRKVFIEK